MFYVDLFIREKLCCLWWDYYMGYGLLIVCCFDGVFLGVFRCLLFLD